MKKNEPQFSFREIIQLTLRGLGVWWQENPKILLSILWSGMIDASTPYLSIWLLARLINEISGNRDSQILSVYVLLLIGFSAGASLVSAVLTRWKKVQLSGLWHVQNKIVMKKLLEMNFADIDDWQVQELRSQIWQNTDSGGWGLYKLIDCFDRIIRSVISIISALFLSVSLFLLPVTVHSSEISVLNHPGLIFLIITFMLCVTFMAPALEVKAGSYWVRYAEENQLGNRLFGFWFSELGHDYSKAMDIRIYRQDILCKNNIKKYNPFIPSSKLAKASRGAMGRYHALSEAVSQLFVGITYIFVCLKALGGAFNVGFIVQYVNAVVALSEGMSMMIETFGNLRNNAPFLQNTFELLDIPNKMSKGNASICMNMESGIEFELRNVSFQYPGREDYALHNISLKFNKGQKIAVVGRNGSGKTTFVKLLCRLYDPTEGEILLNGIDIRKYDYKEYMQLFSVVFQDIRLLPFELGQNISGRKIYVQAKAEQCLYKAGLAEVYSKLPYGLSTMLYKNFDQNGVDISGGEAQKIALARALYKDTPFIILDEPTAALDPLAEAEVYSNMNRIIGNKSAIFISHRLSSCRFCDNILVFHEGKLVQYGNHDILLNDTSGMYYQLWNAQAQYYKKF